MCFSLRPSTYFMGSKVNLGSFVAMGVNLLFWYHLYSTLSWTRSVAGWETTLSRARSVAGWETKLRGASHWILVASSLPILNFQNAITPFRVHGGSKHKRAGYVSFQRHNGSSFFFFFLLLLTLPAPAGQGLILHRVLLLLSFFFLSTCQYLIHQCGKSMISDCIHPKKDVYPFLCKKCTEGAIYTLQKALYSVEKDIERGQQVLFSGGQK